MVEGKYVYTKLSDYIFIASLDADKGEETYSGLYHAVF